jgi:hypothetical protein
VGFPKQEQVGIRELRDGYFYGPEKVMEKRLVFEGERFGVHMTIYNMKEGDSKFKIQNSKGNFCVIRCGSSLVGRGGLNKFYGLYKKISSPWILVYTGASPEAKKFFLLLLGQAFCILCSWFLCINLES